MTRRNYRLLSAFLRLQRIPIPVFGWPPGSNPTLDFCPVLDPLLCEDSYVAGKAVDSVTLTSPIIITIRRQIYLCRGSTFEFSRLHFFLGVSPAHCLVMFRRVFSWRKKLCEAYNALKWPRAPMTLDDALSLLKKRKEKVDEVGR